MINNNFADASLLQTGVDTASDAGEAEFPEPLRFRRMCFRRLKDRDRRVPFGADVGGLGVFVLRDDWDKVDDWTRLHLLHRCETPLASRIWLTNELGHAADYVEHSLDLEGVLAFLLELGVGDRPTVVFDPGTDRGELLFYPNGAAQFMNSEVAYLTEPERLTLEDACEVVQYVYDTSLKSPHHQLSKVSTWSNADKWWVSDRAEAETQSQVRVAVGSRHWGLKVEAEGDVDTGRFDLRFGWPSSDGVSIRWDGVLELKVIKTYGLKGNNYSPAANEAALAKGLVQAATYRDDSSAAWSVLAAFDHRKVTGDDVFEPFRDEAATVQVDLRSWRLFNSVEAYRESLYASSVESSTTSDS